MKLRVDFPHDAELARLIARLGPEALRPVTQAEIERAMIDIGERMEAEAMALRVIPFHWADYPATEDLSRPRLANKRRTPDILDARGRVISRGSSE